MTQKLRAVQTVIPCVSSDGGCVSRAVLLREEQPRRRLENALKFLKRLHANLSGEDRGTQASYLYTNAR